jgi:CelD/BcsL family acetyltransferase involved in cellulose biosynthesis
LAILELNRIDELNDFEKWWNRLLSKSLDNHPFLTYEWLTSWLKHFGKGRELKLFTAESEGSVSLVVPAMYSTRRFFGLKRCWVEFVSSSNSDYQVFSLANFHEAARSINQLIKSIIDGLNVDCIVFGEVPEDSATAKLLENVSGEGFGVSWSVINLCRYIPLPASYDMYLQTLGSSMRRNLKVWERQALKDYKVEFVTYDEIGTIEEAMKIFFELHQKRQKSIGNYGLFSNGAERSFHIDVANAFAKKGWLSLFFLLFNDRPVSSVYCYEYNNKLYAYLCGFDPEYARYRPGHLAMRNVIKYGIEKKLKEFDFLRGNEEYKKRWGTLARNNLEFRITRKGLRSKIRNWASNRPYSYLHEVRGLAKRLFS